MRLHSTVRSKDRKESAILPFLQWQWQPYGRVMRVDDADWWDSVAHSVTRSASLHCPPPIFTEKTFNGYSNSKLPWWCSVPGRTLQWLTCAGCSLCHKHCTRWLGRLSHWTILRALWSQCQSHPPHSTDKNPGQELIRILGDEAWVKPDSRRASYCSWPPFHTGALN